MNNNNCRCISNYNNNNSCFSINKIYRDVWADGISPHHITQYRNHMSNLCINMVNYNKYILSSLDIQYIGYFYYVFPLHPNTFHELFYNHTLPSIEKFKFEIYFFTSNVSGISTDQIESLRQFQSSISQFEKIIDCDIKELNKNIEYISNFNSIVTKCVKSYLRKYITSITNHYNSCYKSLKENLKTFKCIQKCVKTILSNLNGNTGTGNGRGRCNGRRVSGPERYVKSLFSYISDDVNIKSTMSIIHNNNPSKKLGSIDVYLTSIVKFLDESNQISKTLDELNNVKNDLSQFSAYITNYTNRIEWFLIPRLAGLTRPEFTSTLESLKKVRNNNGNGIYSEYETIKHKVEYCKSSLEFEKERLQSISKNARMLQKQLELLIVILNKHKTIENKLKEFSKKLNKMKENKDSRIKYLTTVASSIETNLCKIQTISNSLKFAIRFVRIATIKKDVENIYSCIKDINNILSIVKSHLDSLVGLRLGIDCELVNEFESFIKDIVSGIHSKYCSMSSDISKIFSEPSSEPTLGGCQLTKITECTCSIQDSSEACGICQHDQGGQSCQCCHALQQLSTSCGDSNIGPKLGSIKKVICRLIDGKPVDGCQGNQATQDQCPHICQNNQGGQGGSTCQATSQGEKTTGFTCKETNIAELIKCTIAEIKQCQTSLVKCEDKEQVKCADPPPNSCQITGGTQPPSSCSITTSSSATGVVTCKDLDKVKFWLDTMINKCNCCQFKKMLNDGKVKCFDVFKWIFIYNFRELFCLYISFDKSILNEISCLRDKLEEMKLYLMGINSIQCGINCRIECIKGEITEIPEQFKSLENTMKSGIRQMECAIEGVSRNLILCSLLSNSTHMINSNISNNNMSFNNINLTCVI